MHFDLLRKWKVVLLKRLFFSSRNSQAFELAKLINKLNNFILNGYIVLCEDTKPKTRARSEQSSPNSK